MRLKAIVGMDEETRVKYREIYNKLKEFWKTEFDQKYLNLTVICEEGTLRRENGHAQFTCRGKLKEQYRHFTELELSMIADNGFSHFGGSSNKSDDGSFSVTIYVD